MERSRRSSLALPVLSSKPDVPRLRRKLQKVAKQRPGSGAPPNDSGAVVSVVDRGGRSSKLGPAAPRPPPKPEQPSIARAPDLSDAKWLDYIRRSGYLLPLDSSAQSKAAPASSRAIPINIFPELAHLDRRVVAAAAPPRGSPGQQRPAAPARIPPSSSATMKRRAKTPVFSIGQLEDAAHFHHHRPAHSTSSKASSVELIAEEYRALLESRNSMLTDSHSEPPLSRGGDCAPADDLYVEIRRNSSDDISLGTSLQPSVVAAAPIGDPSSEDETLVSFEEETVYFKPVSFSPEPLSPAAQNHHDFPGLSPSSAPDSLSLQICLDLLSRELLSATRGSDASALQIWVMIEAYERLRDQLLDARLRPEELQPLVLMFDMWLRALYTIHDSLTGEGRTNDSDYEALESEDLD